MRDDADRQEQLAEFIRHTEGRTYSRRAFLGMCALLGIGAAAARLTPAFAAGDEIVLVNWGGDAVAGMKKAFVDPYAAKKPDPTVVIDGAGPASGKIRAMVQSGKVTWDVMDRNLHTSIELGREGVLEKIDYSIVDRTKVRPEHAGEWGIGNYIYSHNMTYNTKAWGGRVPKSWADVFNVKDFPGKRAFRRQQIDGVLEAALMADGVPPEKVYPIDVKRALDKLKSIKEHAIFYDSLAQSQQVFREREAVAGVVLNTRATPLMRDTKGECQFSFDQGIVWVGTWMVPKGNPAKAKVWDFIASTQDPAGQVELFKALGNGPINPAAAALVPDDLRPVDPGNPDNYNRMILGNAEWYAANATAVTAQYMDAISS
jgi:putative spermidine/putrescine transport system substrate-binding protein